MVYISKGIVRQGSTEQRLTVMYCGQEFILTGTEAAIWLDGRFSFGSYSEMDAFIDRLWRKGLVEYEDMDTPLTRYRLLTRCVCCPSVSGKGMLSQKEKEMLVWLKQAGLRLSTEELFFLRDAGIKPVPELLSAANRQTLTETIYTSESIQDGILECQMERAGSRDDTVQILMSLLKKKRILLL